MARWIVAVSVRFRLLVALAAAGLLAAGVIELRRTPVDVLPEFSPPTVEVQTESLGLSAPEVEQLITVPLEQELLNGVKGVESIHSDSIAGLSSIDLVFGPGTDILEARQLVGERLSQTGVLPNVSQAPQMLQPVSSTARVMMIGLSSARLSPTQLSVLARWTIRPRLLGLPGVANVALWGQRDRQLQVLVNPRRLQARGVTLSQIVNTTGNAQLVSPLTFLNASTPGTGGFVDGPNQRLSITHVLPFGAPSNLAKVPIAGARPLTLGDVATVVRGHQPLIGDAIVAGGRGLLLVIEKRPGASTIGVTNEVTDALGDLRPGLEGVRVDSSIFRPASFIGRAIDNVTLGLIIAGALLLVCLLALLPVRRAAAVSLAAVVVSGLAALLALRALGYAGNALVVAGLALAVGVVVDDAVGDAGGVLRSVRRRAGDDPRAVVPAVIDASLLLRRPLAYATLIVLLTAVPVLVSSGVAATFVRPMLVAYCLAVIASLVVAMTLTPALCSLLGARGGGSGTGLGSRLHRRGEALVAASIRIGRRPLFAACGLGLAIVVVAVPFLGTPDRPTFRDRDVVVDLDGAPGTSLTEMDRVTRRAAADLDGVPGVADVGADVGRAVLSDRTVGTGSAQLWVSMRGDADYGPTLSAIRGTADDVPGMRATVSTYEDERSAGVLEGAGDDVDVRVYGENYDVLRRKAESLRHRLAAIPGIRRAGITGLPVSEPTVRIKVSLAAALRHETTPGAIRRQVATLVSGLVVGNFFQQQKVFDVVVRGAPSTRRSVAAVRELLLDTPSGRIRLGRMADVRTVPDPADIPHDAISRYVDVRADPAEGGEESLDRDAQAAIDRTRFPRSYHAEIVRPGTDHPTSHAAFVGFAAAAAIGIVLLLQAAFGSWGLAAAVFCAWPLVAIGGLAGAAIDGDVGSLGALAGIAAVLGIAIRHATVSVARVEDLLRDGTRRPEAVRRAMDDRLGPISLSTLAVALVVLPFAVLGDVAGNEITGPIAWTILGGLAASILFNLVLVPALCHRFMPDSRKLEPTVLGVEE